MIWGAHFVWIHVGRTGGYSVDKMLRILAADDLHLDPLGGEWSAWKRHQTIQQREAETGLDLMSGKIKIANIRRLPHWLLSFAEFKKKYQGLDFQPEELTHGLLRAEYRDLETGNLDASRAREFHADTMLAYYKLNEMDHLFRTENLAADFLNVMEQLYLISPEQRAQIRAVYENANDYSRYSRFSAEAVKQMYQSCPLWTELELKLYGNLLVSV